jgi:hypothetical protein
MYYCLSLMHVTFYWLSGTGSPRVPATRAGTGLGNNLYPTPGTGFLAGIFYPNGHGFGSAIPSGHVPVAISSWSICPLRRFPTGTIWSKPSLETSRAHTCVLGTPGISKATADSQGNPCGTTSDGFRSSAPSYPTSPTRMSSARSSPAPLVTTWSAN